jgi:hypothetical protein
MPPARKITSATHASLAPEATFIVLCNALYSKRNELIHSNFSELIGEGNAFESIEFWTMRSATKGGISFASTTPNSYAQQHLHNHNANLGRIPPNADLNHPPKA